MVQKCCSRHAGPFSLGLERSGQFRCENCGAVMHAYEVYLDATEHADAGKADQRARRVPVSA